MVHDHDDVQPNARKRCYPFIQWVNPDCSPPRKQSPEREEEEAFPPSLPSPPLQSNKYKIFKQDLDRFGGRLKQHHTNGQTKEVKVEEKTRIRKTSWAEAEKDLDRNRSKYSLALGDTKLSKLKPDVHPKKAFSDVPPKCENRKGRPNDGPRARENEMQVSSSGQAYDADSLKSASFDEEEPTAAKRPKYSIDCRPKAPEEEKEYRPNIAESIKLRKPSESRRNKSESYDESDARTIKKILSSSSLLEDINSPLANNCRLTNRISSHPYIKKSAVLGMTGTRIKMVPRTSLLHPGPESGKVINEDGGKVYNVQMPSSNGCESEIYKSVSKHTNDRNHNKVRDNGYDSRKVTISNIAGEVKYRKATPLPGQGQPRPSSTVVSSSTEVINDEDTEEEDEHDGLENGDAKSPVENGSADGRMAGQPGCGPVGGGGAVGRAQWAGYRERPTPYSREGPGQAFKQGQVARSRKFNTRYPAPEKPRQKRAVIQDMVRPLKQWLLRHRHNPYPTKGEKVQLAVGSNMTLVQVSNWFANARRRLKNVVQESRCSWSKRLRLYNQFVQGNAELLSISSDDSIWNSGDEDDGEKSDTGNLSDFDAEVAEVPGIINEHSYTLVSGEGLPDPGSEVEDPELTIHLPGEAEPGGPSPPPSSQSPLSRGSSSPVDSESPPCSPPDTDSIPDTQKYKNRMLVRYLNDAEEAQRHNNTGRRSQGGGSQGTGGGFSSDGEVFPDQSDLPGGPEAAGPRDSPPTLLPEAGQHWQPVDGNLIPTPSNNITISFTHLPLEKDFVPVLTQPPRDNLGVDKAKRQLELGSMDARPGPAPQTVYVSLPTVPLPPSQFSSSQLGVMPVKSEAGRSSASPQSSVSSPSKVFPPGSLRPPFLGSILPGPFPFYPGPGPVATWGFPVPFPHFLHLQPDPGCAEAPPPRAAPPPWLPEGGSPPWAGPPTAPAQHHPASHPRWDEMEAARALSQLASCPVSAGPARP